MSAHSGSEQAIDRFQLNVRRWATHKSKDHELIELVHRVIENARCILDDKNTKFNNNSAEHRSELCQDFLKFEEAQSEMLTNSAQSKEVIERFEELKTSADGRRRVDAFSAEVIAHINGVHNVLQKLHEYLGKDQCFKVLQDEVETTLDDVNVHLVRAG